MAPEEVAEGSTGLSETDRCRGKFGQVFDSELLVTLVDGGSHKSHSSSLGCLRFRQMVADAIVTSGSE